MLFGRYRILLVFQSWEDCSSRVGGCTRCARDNCRYSSDRLDRNHQKVTKKSPKGHNSSVHHHSRHSMRISWNCGWMGSCIGTADCALTQRRTISHPFLRSPVSSPTSSTPRSHSHVASATRGEKRNKWIRFIKKGVWRCLPCKRLNSLTCLDALDGATVLVLG